jgi:hypothetical protein
MSETMLDKIFDSVESSNGDTNTTWAAALSLATVTLRLTDEFNRERLLRGVERSLRNDLSEFERLMEAKKHASS